MDDLISRQAAIEIVDRYNKSHMILQGKPMLGAAPIVTELEDLPSAQPEIIRCKDCIWFDSQMVCLQHGRFVENSNWYCADGKGRRG